MMGMHFAEGDFYSFIQNGNYRPMSPEETEQLLKDEQVFSKEIPIWTLHRTPHARIIERILRTSSDPLPLDIVNYLHDKINDYEKFGHEESGDRQRDAWLEVQNKIIPEIKMKFNEESANVIRRELNKIKLLDW